MHVQALINSSLSKIIADPVFQKWLSGKNIRKDDFIAINNSFIYRDELNTKKAEEYLFLKRTEDELSYDVFVATRLNLKGDFQWFGSLQPNMPPFNTIGDAVESQLDKIGQIIFALIGQIQDELVLSAPFDAPGFTEVTWSSSQAELCSVSNGRLVINNPHAEDSVWEFFVNYCAEQAIVFDLDDAKKKMGNTLTNLQGRAEAKLSLPDKKKKKWLGLTDSIADSLKEQRKEYFAALEKCMGEASTDPDAFNQILRLSYNFASDAIPYLQLIINVCDLKPIVLWSTIGEHFLLSEAFRNLPWARSKYKQSMKGYVDTIGDARNSAFHNAFPFRKTLRFALPPAAFQDAELSFFSEYAPRKNNNELTFQDKELVESFLGFTRARQRPIPPGFWEKNLVVMDKTIDLLQATSNALKYIYTLTKTGG